jgi:hypothetical protein
MKRKVKVTLDGVEREIEIELPDTLVDTADPAFGEAFIPKAVHNVHMAAARKEGQGPKKEELLKDSAFKAEALKAWELDPAKLAGATDQEAVKKAIDTALQPVALERDTLKTRLSTLLDRTLDSDLERFAREAGVKPELLARITPNSPPVIVAMLRQNFAFAEDQGYHAVRGAKDGEFAYSTKPSAERPWQDVAGFFEAWKGTPEAKPFLTDQRQKIGGPSPSGQAPAAGQPPAGGQGGGSQYTRESPLQISQDQFQSGAYLEQVAAGTAVVAPS